MLHKIFLKKGLDPKDADQSRLDRLLYGARPNHPILLKLLLKRTQVVPTYPELIREVREEEALWKKRVNDQEM